MGVVSICALGECEAGVGVGSEVGVGGCAFADGLLGLDVGVLVGVVVDGECFVGGGERGCWDVDMIGVGVSWIYGKGRVVKEGPL